MSDDTLYGLTDEEFMNQTASELSHDDDEFDNTAGSIPDDSEVEDTETEEELEGEESEEEESDEADEGTEEDSQESDDSDVDSEEDDASEEDEADPKEEDKTEEPSSEAEEQLKKLFSPIKANGTEVTLDNIDDAIKLVQMGLNYTKKMTVIKPHLKTVQLLEQHGLLDPNKLNHLIDLSKNDPKAIKKLLTDSNIDPLDLDSDENQDYTPTKYSVSDEAFNTRQVLDEIKDTPSYKDTVGIINKMDEESQNALVANPSVIKTINSHVESGLYNQIMAEVDKRVMLGKIPEGTPKLRAYKMVGDELFRQQEDTQQEPNSQLKKPATPSKRDEKQVRKQRKAAAAVSSAKKPKPAPSLESLDINSMSDDEFLNYAQKANLV